MALLKSKGNVSFLHQSVHLNPPSTKEDVRRYAAAALAAVAIYVRR